MPRPPNPDLPRQLLDAALALLDERGDASFSMRELAGRVGYAVTAVYRCYESRAHLLRALQLNLFAQLAAHVDPPAPERPTAVADRVRGIGRRYLAWATTHPARYRFMFQTAETYGLLTAEERVASRSGLEAFERIIEGGGTTPPLGAAGTAVHMVATLHGLASLWLSGRMEGDLLAYYDDTASAWIGALMGR